MKKIVIGIPVVLFSVLVLLVTWANFVPKEDVAAEENVKTQKVTQQEVTSVIKSENVEHLQPENLQPKEEVVYTDEQMKNPKSEAYQLTITDAGTLEEFLTRILDQWHNGDESGDPEFDRKISKAAIIVDHVNYYQPEIQKLGFEKEFDELQLVAFDIIKNFRNVSDKELAEKFQVLETKLEKVEAR